MTAFLALCFLCLQAAFIWARYAIFRIDGPTAPAVRFIEASATACIVGGTWLIAQRPAGGSISTLLFDLVAIAIALFSAALFTWAVRSIRPWQLTAAFSPDVPLELLQYGAFAWARNPFDGAARYRPMTCRPRAAVTSMRWPRPGTFCSSSRKAMCWC